MNTRQPVTPEAIRLLEGMGFVPVYDSDGAVVEFLERGHYERCLAKGLIKPRATTGGFRHGR